MLEDLESLCYRLVRTISAMPGETDVAETLALRLIGDYERKVIARTQKLIHQRLLDRAGMYEKAVGRSDGKSDTMRYLAKVALEAGLTGEWNPSDNT